MLPFPLPPNLLEKPFSEQLELNPPLPPTNPYFPFSPPIFASDDSLLLPFSAATAVISQPSPPSLPLHHSVVATTLPLLNKTRNGSISRKRALRKDRHSKIVTAAGPRDRRIRLSREVARQFFDLQDMLGFDQGSKTVQWLLTMSKHAIQEVATFSAPELCDLSDRSPKPIALEFEKVSLTADSKGKSTTELVTANEVKKKSKNYKKRTNCKHSGNAAPGDVMLARESRAKARARARERTTEKNRMCSSHAAKDDSGLLNTNSSLLESLAHVEEDGCSSSNSLCIKLANEGSYTFPVADGLGLVPILDHREKIAGFCDMDIIFQEQWDMDRILLAD